MRKVLIPIDGSERSLQAVGEMMRQARASVAVEIHLLNVQPRVFPDEMLSYMPADQADTYYYSRAADALAPAEQLLRVAGVPFVSHRAVGPIAETIVEKRRELDCDSIVMGSRGHGKLAGLLLGSVATQVLHLADVPVTLITQNIRPG